MHRYRAAAKRAAWYGDDDNYNPFGKVKVDNDSRLNRLEAELTNKIELNERQSITLLHHADTLPQPLPPSRIIEGAVPPPKNTPASTFLSPFWRRSKPFFDLPAQNDLRTLLVESGLLLAAPMGFARIRTQRPTKVSVVELCSSHEPPKEPISNLKNEYTLWGPSQKQGDGTNFLKMPITKHLSKVDELKSPADWRVIYIQDDTTVFKGLTNLHRIEFRRHRVKFDEWSTGRLDSSPKGKFPVGSLDLSATSQTVFWRPEFDHRNKLTRTAFGLEYLAPWRPDALEAASSNSANTTSHASIPGDCLQRLSVYLQLRNPDKTSDVLPDGVEKTNVKDIDKTQHSTENTIIIFDTTSRSFASEDLLLGSGPWHELVDDVNSAKSQADQSIAIAVIGLLFDAVAEKWDDYIMSMHQHIVSLEEKIYDNPANDAQSSTLWSVSKEILQAERLLKSHLQLLDRIQYRLAFLITFDPQQSPSWLRQNIEEFTRLSSEIEETLKKPIAHIIDLMYKSVSIHDARQSLDLNTSLWRLSWITFIFLPLTFLVGFFGMNVDTFKPNPSLKWYFIAAVPLMVSVLLAWLATRQWMRRDVTALQAMRRTLRSRS